MDEVRLLIVDDEPIRFVLGRAFKLLGYDVTMAASGEEALSCLEKGIYRLMILDMELPGMGGLEVISLVRKKWPMLSIIVLTGHASVENAVSAFKSEVVDYLQKPATLEVVLDAVTTALHKQEVDRRKTNLAQMMQEFPDLLSESSSAPAAKPTLEKQEPHALFVRPLLLDRSDRSVKFVDQPDRVAWLTRGETAVLYMLMSYPDQALSCQQLVQGAWGYEADDIDAQSIIRPYISRLRQKLEDDGAKPRRIRTVRNRGYMLISERK